MKKNTHVLRCVEGDGQCRCSSCLLVPPKMLVFAKAFESEPTNRPPLSELNTIAKSTTTCTAPMAPLRSNAARC